VVLRASLVDDGVDAGGVDAVLANRLRGRTEQASRGGFFIACGQPRDRFFFEADLPIARR